jgi:malate/lactate dehydrogenase
MSAEIAIVGAGGGVGSSVAFNLLRLDAGYDVAMVDGRSGLAQSHQMDLEQVVAAGAAGSVRLVGHAEMAQADVVVVSASEPLTSNRSRLTYLRSNAAIVEQVTAEIRARPGWPGVVVVVTNPVDALVTRLHRLGSLERHRVLGYTANDSLRLRTAVGERLGVPPHTVDAWVLGEHGDHCIPLLDRIRVDGLPATLDEEQRRASEDFVRGWYIRHVALEPSRSSTWTTGLGVARMVHAIVNGGHGPWPASVVLDGEYGVHDTALGVPVTLGPSGVEQIHEWPLGEDELAAFSAAAEAVRVATDELG